jgi:hypothetical protein
MINIAVDFNSISFFSEDGAIDYKYISQSPIMVAYNEVVQGKIPVPVYDFIIHYQDRLEYYIFLMRLIEKNWHVCFLGYQSYNIVEKLLLQKMATSFTVLDIVDPKVDDLNYEYFNILSSQNRHLQSNYDLVISYGMLGWLSNDNQALSELDISVVYYNILSLTKSRLLISIKEYDNFQHIEPYNGRCISKYTYFFNRDNKKLINSLNLYKLY